MKTPKERVHQFIKIGMGKVAYLFLSSKGLRLDDFLRIIKDLNFTGEQCMCMIYHYLPKRDIEEMLKKI